MIGKLSILHPRSLASKLQWSIGLPDAAVHRANACQIPLGLAMYLNETSLVRFIIHVP